MSALSGIIDLAQKLGGSQGVLQNYGRSQANQHRLRKEAALEQQKRTMEMMVAGFQPTVNRQPGSGSSGDGATGFMSSLARALSAGPRTPMMKANRGVTGYEMAPHHPSEVARLEREHKAAMQASGVAGEFSLQEARFDFKRRHQERQFEHDKYVIGEENTFKKSIADMDNAMKDKRLALEEGMFWGDLEWKKESESARLDMEAFFKERTLDIEAAKVWLNKDDGRYWLQAVDGQLFSFDRDEGHITEHKSPAQDEQRLRTQLAEIRENLNSWQKLHDYAEETSDGDLKGVAEGQIMKLSRLFTEISAKVYPDSAAADPLGVSVNEETEGSGAERSDGTHGAGSGIVEEVEDAMKNKRLEDEENKRLEDEEIRKRLFDNRYKKKQSGKAPIVI